MPLCTEPTAAVAAQVVSDILRSRTGKGNVVLPREDSSTDTEDSDDSGNEEGEEVRGGEG